MKRWKILLKENIWKLICCKTDNSRCNYGLHLTIRWDQRTWSIFVVVISQTSRNPPVLGPRPVKTVEDRWKPLLWRSCCQVKKHPCSEPLHRGSNAKKNWVVWNCWRTNKTWIFHMFTGPPVRWRSESFCSVWMTYHYLNQCWLIFNWFLRSKLQWNSNQFTKLFFQENSDHFIQAAVWLRSIEVMMTFDSFLDWICPLFSVPVPISETQGISTRRQVWKWPQTTGKQQETGE